MAVVAVAVAVAVKYQDRFGIGWRPEYAASILMNADEIDIVEVISENFVNDKDRILSLKTLSAQIPITVHSVSLGLASSIPVKVQNLENMARLFDVITPDAWSEHFAFVRAGGYEIGHLAAPPRNEDTIQGTIKNICLATDIIGMQPYLENIATLVSPPCSIYSEYQWINKIVSASSAGILLDLHNLLANSYNFGFCPKDFIAKLELSKVHQVHLSGGKYIPNPLRPDRMHLLDDHLHDVPKSCYELLTFLSEHCPNNLTVIIERDGHFPAYEHMLLELRKAKQAVQNGREKKCIENKGVSNLLDSQS